MCKMRDKHKKVQLVQGRSDTDEIKSLVGAKIVFDIIIELKLSESKPPQGVMFKQPHT